MLRSRDTDAVGDSSGRSYVTEQGHNVPLLRTSVLKDIKELNKKTGLEVSMIE